jgi:orotate phosphoribosyltransferase
MIINKEIATEIAKELLDIKAIQLSPDKPFTWASGRLSPIYCDNRKVLSFPIARKKVYDAFAKYISENFKEYDVIAGVATGAIAHGVLVAEALGKPFIYVRDKPKGHGMQNVIEGDYRTGQKVIVIEDLISTGGSSLKAVIALREAGLEVLHLVAIFSYHFDDAVANFKNENCPYHTLSDFPTLIEISKENKQYSEESIAFMEEWYRG